MLNPGGASREVLVLSVELCGICGRRAGRGGSSKVAAIVCMMLWMRWFGIWKSVVMALMMLCILAACDFRISVNASIRTFVLWLMWLEMVLNLTFIVVTKSFMALLKTFLETKEIAATWLLMTCVFWAIASRTGV